MSPTLLEFAVALILVVVAWQIGLAIAPGVLRALRALKRDVDEATEEAFVDFDSTHNQARKEEHTNGTRR